MKTLGAAKLSIVADASGMAKGVKDAKREFAKLNKTISHAKQVMAGAFVAVGLHKGLTELREGIGHIADEMERIDKIGKVSDKLGLNPKDLLALRHAGTLTGVGENTMDMAMQRMTRRIAEAKEGIGEARGALKELNLDAGHLAKVGPAQAFREIAGAMQHVESQSDKVRLAFKLFDSEGVALVNTLKLGEKGLLDAATEADNLGITLDRIDIAKVEAANDAIYKAKQAFSGFLMSATVELAPFAKVFAEMFTEKIVDARKAIEDSSSGVRNAANEFGILGKAILVAANALQIYAKYQADNLLFMAEVAPWTTQAMIGGVKDDEEWENWKSWLKDKSDHMFDTDWSDSIAKKASAAYDEIKTSLNAQPLPTTEYNYSAISGYKKQDVDPFSYFGTHGLDATDIKGAIVDVIPTDALLSIADAAKKFRESLTTEADAMLAEAKRIEAMQFYGTITQDEANQGLKKIIDRHKEIKPNLSASFTTQAYTKGSDRAYSAIVNAMGRDPAKREEKEDRKGIRKAVETIAQKIKQNQPTDSLDLEVVEI